MKEKKVLGAVRSLTLESAWTRKDSLQLRDESSVVWCWFCPSLPICIMGASASTHLEKHKVSSEEDVSSSPDYAVN